VHEYSIASALLEQVGLQAKRHAATEVLRVQVRVGEASGVEPALLRTAWELVREGTLCGSAVLDLERVPLRWACPVCEAGAAAGEALRCRDCGTPLRLVAGQELLLERIEMEVA
jgi:hydrogenase nickel incorporation protein HypA/HybF